MARRVHPALLPIASDAAEGPLHHAVLFGLLLWGSVAYAVLPTRWVLPECLHVPIAAVDEAAA